VTRLDGRETVGNSLGRARLGGSDIVRMHSWAHGVSGQIT